MSLALTPPVLNVSGGVGSGQGGFLGNVVHQIVHVKHVAAGENAFRAGLQLVVYVGAGGDAVHLHAGPSGQLILRDQAHGEQKGVTAVLLLRAGDRFAVRAYLCQGDAGHSLLALDVHYGMAQFQRDAVVVQALHDVSL